MSFDLMSIGYSSVVAYAGLSLYDYGFNGKSLSETFTMYDSASFALSIILSNYSFDILSSFLPYLNDNNVIRVISKPLLNGLIYQYLYGMFVGDKYPYERSNTKSYIIGAIGSLLLNYLQNPVLSMFGIRNFGY